MCRGGWGRGGGKQGDATMQPHALVTPSPGNAHILLACALLRLDKACCPVDAHNQVASDLGVQGAAVTSLVDTQHAADPGHHLCEAHGGPGV